MSKNDDALTSFISGAFWTSAAIGTNAGPIGCLFAIAFLIWGIIVPGFCFSLIENNPERSIKSLTGLVLLGVWCFVSIKLYIRIIRAGIKNKKEMEEKTRQSTNESNELQDK